jgi:hypothetical protein
MTTPFIDFAKRVLPKSDVVGAEVGVRVGQNATYILDNFNFKKFLLIDGFNEYIDTDGFYSQERQDTLFIRLTDIIGSISLFKRFENVIEIMKMDSLEAAEIVKDNELDFVYIDANHDYEFVKKDLDVWKNKVKSGGIIGGHDYNYPDTGVKKAVDEFVEENKYQLNVLNVRPGNKLGIEWAIIKK